MLSLKKIEGLIDSSFNKKIKGSALVEYKPGLIKLDNMKLSSGKSILNGNLIVKGKNNSLSDFKSNAIISFHLSSASGMKRNLLFAFLFAIHQLL